MAIEIFRILHEEAKIHYVSEHTHVDICDLYGEYLDYEVKNFRDKTYECNSDGIRVINTADSWIFMYTRAIGINPIDAEIYFKRASFYEIRGKQDEAIKDYSEAIKLKPDYADAYLKRSICYKKTGLYDEAISDYNEVIRLIPEYAYYAVLYGFNAKTVTVAII